MLEEDLQLLKSLFDAEGEGLSRQQIEELCAPLAGLLVVMQLDSGILMANYKQVPPSLLLCAFSVPGTDICLGMDLAAVMELHTMAACVSGS